MVSMTLFPSTSTKAKLKGLEPLSVSGASILTTAVRADGWVLVPPEVEGYDEGEVVEARLY